MICFKLKKYAKRILLPLEKVLPQSTFDKFCSFVLPRYKAFAREAYRTKNIVYLLTGNKKGREMVKNIYQIMPYTLVGIGGLEATYMLAKMMNEKGVEGNFVELGVAKGGCAALMAGVAFSRNNRVERQIWLFDSFEGLPDPTEEDFCQTGPRTTGDHLQTLTRGSCLGTLEEVQDLFFERYRFPRNKVFFVKGWFKDTLPTKGKDVGKIAILRIDGDWYESTKCCLEFLYDHVIEGGAVIVDDYQSCFGCKKAVDEFMTNRNLNLKIFLDGRGGCYFIKP
jgi:hypothetical protein